MAKAKQREEQQLSGCLLQSGIQYPQEKVMVCGPCPNRSDMRGNLGLACKATPSKEKT